MNCTHVREKLPELLYGDLPQTAAAELENHLVHCPACRSALSALGHLRRTLDTLPAPSLAVDLPRLYDRAARRREKQLRRWRRAAVVLAAVAAGLVVALGLRLEVRCEAHQLVVRWGTPDQVAVPPPAPQAPREVAPQATPVVTVTAEEMQLIRELVHALASDVELRDRRQREQLTRLNERLDAFQRRTDVRWAADTRRLLPTPQTAPVEPRRKGVNQ
jgi:anti-sigma factor RsiW